MSGTLILCATPIGNLDDAPPRLAAALAGADVIYAEDTRRSRTLLAHLGVDKPLRSFFAGNEAERAAELAERLRAGHTVALVTDAGTPALSDPGYLAVRSAVDVGADVTVVPGPSAVTAALAVAGLPAERFTFEGFLPRKGGPRRRRLEEIGRRRETTVVFASPTRLAADLADVASIDPRRRVVVARELTKLHEEVWRGTAEDAASRWSDGARGEITIVIAGAAAPDTDVGAAVDKVLTREGEGATFADAVREVAADEGVSRRLLYQAALEKRGD